MLAIAALRWSPIASADGSLKVAGSVAVEAGAGDGVAGGCCVVEVVDAGAGGAAGVEAVCAGVAGSAAGFGAALGYHYISTKLNVSDFSVSSLPWTSCTR